MSSQYKGLELMVELGLSYVDATVNDLSDELKTELAGLFRGYLHGDLKYDNCRERLIAMIGRDDALVRIREIMAQPDEPLSYRDDVDDSPIAIRKKTRTWTALEDQRLLAGVARFGIDNWQTVAHFLGNGRNRAQCSQRWTRCLNPKISKKSWSVEDDLQLKELVKLYGDKSWTKIASIIGNRSDVQCRYHFKQMTSGDEEQPINRQISKAMSSENFNIQNNVGPSKLEDRTTGLLSLSKARGFASTPLFLQGKDLQMVLPLAPITKRMRSQEARMPSLPTKLSWGVTGTDEQSLSTFLSNFE